MSGREVTILVNEVKPPGFYEATFNPTDLPGGVNFYQLREGIIIETKKMILTDN